MYLVYNYSVKKVPKDTKKENDKDKQKGGQASHRYSITELCIYRQRKKKVSVFSNLMYSNTLEPRHVPHSSHK